MRSPSHMATFPFDKKRMASRFNNYRLEVLWSSGVNGVILLRCSKSGQADRVQGQVKPQHLSVEAWGLQTPTSTSVIPALCAKNLNFLHFNNRVAHDFIPLYHISKRSSGWKDTISGSAGTPDLLPWRKFSQCEPL